MVEESGVKLLTTLVAARLLDERYGQVAFRHDWLQHWFVQKQTNDPQNNPPGSAKLVLGLTGNIATGKSTVLNMLETLGAKTIDADQLVHQLREPGAAGYMPLITLLGEDILHEDGRINVAVLSERAFKDAEILAQLERIFHPLVRAEVERLISESQQQVIVVEAIKLLDGDLKNRMNSVWVVDTPPEEQIRRLMTDRACSREIAIRRIDAQAPQVEKLALANVIIHNDGDLKNAWRQVLDAWAEVLAELAQDNIPDSRLVATFIHVCLEQVELSDDFEVIHTGLFRLAEAIDSGSSHWITGAEALKVLMNAGGKNTPI